MLLNHAATDLVSESIDYFCFCRHFNDVERHLGVELVEQLLRGGLWTAPTEQTNCPSDIACAHAEGL
jgi:hypothetical protein